MGFTAHESKTDPADPQRGAEPAAPAQGREKELFVQGDGG